MWMPKGELEMLKRPVLVLGLLVLTAIVTKADTLLLNERIDCQEITEVRFTAPPGCVITGLGFRAHQDNITTMHCRYHVLTPEGRLTNPQEVRLGYEPDHDCEAKVYLPDGWVAVGFGAAAEPEWDVTLLRVWARRLRSDGTLGELRVFNDGFKPTREPERLVLLAEPDRVLTGAGLRFHFNDIIGVYGHSRQIVQLNASDKAKLTNFRIDGWFLDGLENVSTERLFEDLKKHGVRHLYVRPHDLSSTTSLNDLANQCRRAGVSLFVYLQCGIAKETIDGLVRSIKPKGIIVDAESITAERKADVDNCIAMVAAACRKSGCKTYVRVGRLPAQNTSRDIGVVLASNFLDGDNEPRANLRCPTLLAEIEIVRPIALASGVPDAPIEDVQSQILRAARAGIRDFVVNVHSGGNYLLGSASDIALYAAKSLVKDPLQPTDVLWDKLCALQYGTKAKEVKSVLQQATSANDLIFNTLGLDLLWQTGKLATLSEIRSKLHQIAKSNNSRESAIAKALLIPTQETLSREMLEGETTLWLIRQAADVSQLLAEGSDSKTANALSKGITRQQEIALLSNLVSKVAMLALLYAQDAAPVTRGLANSAISDLEKAAGESSTVFGKNPVLSGVTEFLESARSSLADSAENAPIALAFKKVSNLSNLERTNEAAAELSNIMNSNEFAPYINNHWSTIGDLASGLVALGQPDAGVRIRWGGDGRWRLEKVAGHWCVVTSREYPCIYYDVPGEPLKEPADFVVTFEYFDEGDWQIHLQYDSNYPPDQGRQYHEVEPLQLTDTKTWKEGSFTLTNCLFSSAQNMEADMRFLSGKGIRIRNVRLSKK